MLAKIPLSWWFLKKTDFLLGGQVNQFILMAKVAIS